MISPSAVTLHLRSGNRRPDRVELDVTVPVHDGNARDLGLTVDLLQVHSEGVEETEMVRAHGRAAGVCVAEPGQTEVVSHLFLHGRNRPADAGASSKMGSASWRISGPATVIPDPHGTFIRSCA